VPAIIILVGFLVLMTVIGVWGMRKTKTVSDFFLGGRTLGPWISAFAYGTTYFSAVLFIGFAGTQGWAFGFNSLWIAAGNTFIGALAAWLVLGKRTRRMSQNLDSMTMPEFFKERYDSQGLKIMSAVIIFIFLIPYSASVFKGLSHLFEAYFHIPYQIALLIMIAVTGLYLILGGYFAVTLNDFIQGILMIGGAIAMVVIFMDKAGGLGQVFTQIPVNYAQNIPIEKQPDLITIASVVFMTSFGAWGLPQMVQKFYSIKDEKRIPRAAIVTTVFSLIIVFAAYFTGAMTHLFYTPQTLPMDAGAPSADRIIPTMIAAHLPELMGAVILLLVLSASMSTLASLVLVSSSAVTIDLYKGQINPKVSKERTLLLMRIFSAVFIGLSFLVASMKIDVIVTLMSISWGSVAGAFMAPYLFGLYWKRATKPAVWAGMITGVVLALGLYILMGASSKVAPIASSIAMIAPFIVVPVVSLLTKPPKQEILEKAFQK